jgi:pimeloyl-ACP methyl ester carboxylesterase
MDKSISAYRRRYWGWGKRFVAGGLVLFLILGCGIWIAGARAKSTLRKRYPPPGQLVDVGGYKMHIHCMGQGAPTVVLAAGLDDFSIFWSLVQPEVAQVTRTCAFDRAGLGWSEASPTPRTGENMVRELHSLLAYAGVEAPYVLVGHSFGGAQTLLYADRYPGDVAGMVLVDAAPADLFDRVPVWARLIQQKIRLYRSLAWLNAFGLLPLAAANIPSRGLPEEVLAQYRAIVVSTSYFRTAIAENEMFEMNLAELRAARIALAGMPVTVIGRGYWEPIPSLSAAENQQAWQAWQEMQSELLAIAGGSRVMIATRSEHNIQLQQPQLVISEIGGVVEGTRE